MLLATLLAISPTWATYQHPPELEPLRVTEVQADDTVTLAGPSPLAGTVLTTYRLRHGRWQRTGRLKVAADGRAAVTAQSPAVWAGDLALPPQLTIQRRQVLLPAVTLAYRDLFADPKAEPGTYELTPAAAAALAVAAQPFAKARVGVLHVEGYTDGRGAAETNQLESYQRALVVRQHLIDELGFAPHRVLAVGYGESDAQARQIVLKVPAGDGDPGGTRTPGQ